MTIPLQPTPFMQVLTTEQIMDSQTIIDAINSSVKDKTLLVRFYNLQNGTDIWIDGLCWRLYDFDMVEYLDEEYGIILDAENLSFDILKSDDDFIDKTCFNKNLFSMTSYDEVQDLLDNLSKEAILVGKDFGIPYSSMYDAYRGKFDNFEEFVKQEYSEACLDEVMPVLKYFDWSKVAEEWEQGYHHSEGFVFDATYS